MLDATDVHILELLRTNARMAWKDIGEQVHLTGQAVAGRIKRMEQLGVIETFTVKTNPLKMGLPVYALIIVFMKTTQHAAFRRFLEQEPLVEQAHRSSGEGCFWLTARCPDQDQLSGLLDRILPYGNYRVTLSIGVVK